MRLKKSNAAMPAIVLALSMAGVAIKCSDSDLAKVTDGLTIATHGLEAAKKFQVEHAMNKEATLKAAYEVGTLTKEAANAAWAEYGKDATVAADINLRLHQATLEVNAYVTSLAKLDPEARTNIKNLLKPLIDGFIHSIDVELPRIKNPELKATIRGYLVKGRDALEIVFALIGKG